MIDQENTDDTRLIEVESHQDSFGSGAVSTQNTSNIDPPPGFSQHSASDNFHYQHVHHGSVFPTIVDEYAYESLPPGDEDKLRSVSPLHAPHQHAQQQDAYLTAMYGGHHPAQHAHYAYMQDLGMVAPHFQQAGQGHPGSSPPHMQGGHHAAHGHHQPWNLGQHHTQAHMHPEGEHHKVDARMNPDAVMAAQLQMEAALRILSMTGAPPGNQPMDAASVHSHAQGGYVGSQQDQFGLGTHSHGGHPQFDPHQLHHAVDLGGHGQHNLYATHSGPSHQTQHYRHLSGGGGGRGGGSSQSGRGGGYSSSVGVNGSGYFDSLSGSGSQAYHSAYQSGFSGRGKGRGGGGRGRGRGRAGSHPIGPVGYKAPEIEPISLEGLNPPADQFRYDPPQSARFFVIKSYSEDDVHKSIKYGLWTSTETGNRRLNTAFKEILITAGVSGAIRMSDSSPTGEPLKKEPTEEESEPTSRNQEEEGDVKTESSKDGQEVESKEKTSPKEWTPDMEPPAPIYLFFSVNASGQFCGMAQMMSPVNFDSQFTAWAQSKWKGQFKVKWVFVKDIPNSTLRHIILANNENKPVTNSRDTQEIPFHQGCEMVRLFGEYQARTSLLDDFAYYDKRQAAMESGSALGTMEASASSSLHPTADEGLSASTGDFGDSFPGRGGGGRGPPSPGRRKRYMPRGEVMLNSGVADLPLTPTDEMEPPPTVPDKEQDAESADESTEAAVLSAVPPEPSSENEV